MVKPAEQSLGLLPKLVLAALIALVIVGAVWHGVTIETFKRIWFQLLERPSGPMRFRFVLQPIMAAVFAVRDGIRDARTGRMPFLWAMLYRPGRRFERIEEALNATARIILLGLIMDVIYQVIVLDRFYPAESVIIAIVLAFLPYLIIRGPAARIARVRRAVAK